ncbi:hypothetical protein PanWU01x14_105460 [Parasponia andersonii]|uniref:Uncharacterized protein n=1 Tax=Parasponia andersonii TaxID=3476 RepID=A0A2P5D0Y3_PARAD|nr:hypothetical protein PanWU01x14_105460 [Parasponia andersonii]
MASGSNITNSVDTNGGLPARPRTYTNLYKWPEPDGESVRLLGPIAKAGRAMEQPKVVDSVSCRQVFLRSYTFSRKESFSERTKKCFGRVLMLFRRRARVGRGTRRAKRAKAAAAKRKMAVKKRAKGASCASLMLSNFRRWLLYIPRLG